MKSKIVIVFLLFTSLLLPLQASAAEINQITVMSRNLYLGADVGVALNLIPDMPAAAQFMWDQMKKTNFSARATKLAAEIAAAKPAVIGLQEATVWSCKKGFFSKSVEVWNFTKILLEALEKSGLNYSIATKNGKSASNSGYSIPPIQHITMVNDPEIFQPLFGRNKVACGFTIGDVLLVRNDLVKDIVQVGNTEYDAAYSVVPTIMTIYRGFTWADIRINGTAVRFITTHLESLWDKDKIPNSVAQAKQLVADLQATKNPIVLIGDFNSDPRDPRGPNTKNPGGQPESGLGCSAQVKNPNAANAIDECSPYWTMIHNGFTDLGPDAQLGKNYSWGASALLAGPDKARYNDGLLMGNEKGFTDRVDYIFTKGAITLRGVNLIGNDWPNGVNNWPCNSPEQVSSTQEISALMKVSSTGEGVCFPSDHAGLVATIEITQGSGIASALIDSHGRFPLGIWHLVGFLLLSLISFTTYRTGRRIYRWFVRGA